MVFEIIGSFIGAFAFALLLHAPRKAVLRSSFIATLGYTLFSLICASNFSQIGSYFIATFVLTLLSEMAARKMKMPATIFLTPAIIPLVPGLGLYESMLAVLEMDYLGFLQTIVHTILIVCTMAAAIAVSSQSYRLLVHSKNISG